MKIMESRKEEQEGKRRIKNKVSVARREIENLKRTLQRVRRHKSDMYCRYYSLLICYNKEIFEFEFELEFGCQEFNNIDFILRLKEATLSEKSLISYLLMRWAIL